MEKKKKVLLLGGIIIDRYYEVESYPKPGQAAVILNSFDKVGGCAINVAVTLQNLGAIPYVVSKLGDDENGRLIMSYVQSLALPTECITIETNRKTGYCLTIIDKMGERTFFSFKGCENEFPSVVLPDELYKNITFSYVTGYYLLERGTASNALKLIKKLKDAGCRILFDPGPLVAHMSISQLSTMLALSDLIIPNRYELELIKDKLALPCDLHKWLHKGGCQYIVVKKGIEGVEVHTSEQSMKMRALQMKCVDTTGAGDSFAGGLIYALAYDFELRKAIELASGCGAYTTTVKGPHGAFSIDDIYKMIKTQKEDLR